MRSTDILRRYIDIVNESTSVTENYHTYGAMEHHVMGHNLMSKEQAHYTPNSPGADTCGRCENFKAPNQCRLVLGNISPAGWCKFFASEEEELVEKWDKPTKVSPEEKGKYAGKSKAELLKSYNALKKSGPHKKGSPEYGRMRELAFAIRAKSNWGKVGE